MSENAAAPAEVVPSPGANAIADQAVATNGNHSTAPVSSEPDTRPAVLIVGGLGYIGRFLAHYIHTNKLASTLRLVDKQLPQLASLAPEHQEACSQNFLQADGTREQSQGRIYDLPPGPNGKQREFDYVFNCGGETRFSQEDEVYKLRSYQLSLAVGKEAAKRGVKAFVEVSTGTVYNPNRNPQKESDKTSKPHTKQAKWKLAAEDELAKIPGLRLVVLRLPFVYGPYAAKGWIGTQLALARVYQAREPKETLKWLWGAELRTNTLHVEDTARALWMAAEWRSKNDRLPNVSAEKLAFNVVDKGATSQGTMARIIKEVFGVDTGFQGTLVNTFARLNLEHVVDDVNDDTLDDWADLLADAGIGEERRGPLSPFMEKELLRDADLSLDGGRFEQVVGFR
ncbi:NAD(P)-binding protein [Teratosphaeria nubilosa]|uniref:NAD(P)-binding protein n=1 Tax=Teratosphaeria nubilosa TaxID=161662 RepID=A0A6G1LIP7_9PEZI|nr:NAD(P)-binding protein [Teratosphaeria nubilosa]